MNLPSWKILDKVPRAFKYGVFSGLLSALISIVIVGVVAAYSAITITGRTLLDFDREFFSIYVFVQLISFILWAGISQIITALLIPENEKRLKQSFLFLSNGFVALIEMVMINIGVIIIIFILSVLLAN